MSPPRPARGPHERFRAHARRVVRLRAFLTHVEAGWQRHVDVVNLGLGGAGIVTDDPLYAGDAVTLSLVAPTLWDPLVIRGRVVWARAVSAMMARQRAGIAFDHEGEAEILALFEMVAATVYDV